MNEQQQKKHILLMKKANTKAHMYMKCPGKANLWRQKVDEWSHFKGLGFGLRHTWILASAVLFTSIVLGKSPALHKFLRFQGISLLVLSYLSWSKMLSMFVSFLCDCTMPSGLVFHLSYPARAQVCGECSAMGEHSSQGAQICLSSVKLI